MRVTIDKRAGSVRSLRSQTAPPADYLGMESGRPPRGHADAISREARRERRGGGERLSTGRWRPARRAAAFQPRKGERSELRRDRGLHSLRRRPRRRDQSITRRRPECETGTRPREEAPLRGPAWREGFVTVLWRDSSMEGYTHDRRRGHAACTTTDLRRSAGRGRPVAGTERASRSRRHGAADHTARAALGDRCAIRRPGRVARIHRSAAREALSGAAGEPHSA